MAAYASAAGLTPIIFLPHGNISYGKLAQALEYGALTVQVEANFDEILRLVRELAEKTGISDKLLLEWVNHADLFRIKGVGEEYADLLEEAGVDTIPELAQRNPANLYEALEKANAQKKLVRQLPTRAQVESWVEQAKALPRVVSY